MKTPSPNKNRVLGVDPGLATTGWGIVEKNGLQLTLHRFGAILECSLERRRHSLPQIAFKLGFISQVWPEPYLKTTQITAGIMDF